MPHSFIVPGCKWHPTVRGRQRRTPVSEVQNRPFHAGFSGDGLLCTLLKVCGEIMVCHLLLRLIGRATGWAHHAQNRRTHFPNPNKYWARSPVVQPGHKTVILCSLYVLQNAIFLQSPKQVGWTRETGACARVFCCTRHLALTLTLSAVGIITAFASCWSHVGAASIQYPGFVSAF